MAKATESASVTAGYDYNTLKVRGVDGRIISSRGNGDAVHRAMLLHASQGGTLDDIIEKNSKHLSEKMAAHADKQSGLRSMSLGVIIRKLVKDGTPIKIGKTVVEKLNQKVELPKVEPIERAASAPKAAKKVPARKAAKKRSRKVAEAA